MLIECEEPQGAVHSGSYECEKDRGPRKELCKVASAKEVALVTNNKDEVKATHKAHPNLKGTSSRNGLGCLQ